MHNVECFLFLKGKKIKSLLQEIESHMKDQIAWH